MAHVRSLMELSPAELRSRPAIRNFGPFREQTIRQGWFKWFWLGYATDSNHVILVGPFKTRWGAKRAWAKVPAYVDTHDNWEHRPGTRALQHKFPN